jgi:acetolactate synthase-1/2/3 large subunit
MREAFYIARSGRPGPVLVDVPKDVQNQKTEFIYPEGPIRLPGYLPPSSGVDDDIQAAVELINQAERPIILAGAGIGKSGASEALLALAEKGQIPVALTLLGKGGMSEKHPLTLGMMGMHGEAAVNYAIQEADLLIALGMRFDDRVTGNLKTYAPKAKKIHVDIDPSEINKNVRVNVGIAGDVKTVIEQLIPGVKENSHPTWLNTIRDWQEDSDERDIINRDTGGRLLAAQVIHDLWQITGGNAITATDVGQHQMLEAQYYPHLRPKTLITSGGLGTMGFGLPAAIGAKFGRPDEEVWAIAGDGGFQMTMCELATAAQEGLNINIAVVNNGFLGMVRQWQELFHESRYNSTPMYNPDFVKLAEAFGIPARRVTKREEVADAVNFARSVQGPALIEFVVEREDMVYPMVPAGSDLHAMIRRPKPNEE